MRRIMGALRTYSDDDISQVLRNKVRIQKEIKGNWDALQLDAMICPSFYHSGFKSKDVDLIGSIGNYLVLWNIMHYPAGTIPVTEVKTGEDENYSDAFGDWITRDIKRTIKGSVGMPISIQVASKRWQDEKCLAVMKIIDDEV
jgi:fatty acid amide hydrolase